MWLKKEGDLRKINLDDLFRISKTDTTDFISIKFEFRGSAERWSKFHFKTKEERDNYWDDLDALLDIKEVELDVIGKLK